MIRDFEFPWISCHHEEAVAALSGCVPGPDTFMSQWGAMLFSSHTASGFTEHEFSLFNHQELDCMRDQNILIF